MIKDLTCNSTKNRDVKRIKRQKEEGRGTFYFEGNFEKARETLPGSHRDLSLCKESIFSSKSGSFNVRHLSSHEGSTMY